MELDPPSYKDSRMGVIRLGKVMRGSSKKYDFFLSLKDLEKHMFICGSTGTGKSNYMQNFITNFSKLNDIPFFLVEFKGEYHFLQNSIENLLILWPGENFSINIFDPDRSNPEIHAERIFEIFKSGLLLDENSEFSPQMEKVMVDILTEACKNIHLRNWDGFIEVCDQYLQNNRSLIPMLKQTLISIKNRIRRYSKGPLKALFETKNQIALEKLFDYRVILDLSSIIRLGGDKEDALFFLNVILKYMWDKNLSRGAINFEGIKHVTIIEDAQYFAPQEITKKSKLTTYLEDIALLQRGTGECLITLATRPSISKEILANNGIVLTFKNHIEKDILCELLNLDPENKNYLSNLEEGQCLVRINSIKEPFLMWVPHLKRNYPSTTDIRKKNAEILKVLDQKLYPNPIEMELVRKMGSNTPILDPQNTINELNLADKKQENKQTVLSDNNLRTLGESMERNDIKVKDEEETQFEDFKALINELFKIENKNE